MNAGQITPGEDFTKGRSGMERLYAESVDLSLRGVFQSSSSVRKRDSEKNRMRK